MALNLWKIGGKPTSYNPLSLGWGNQFNASNFGDYTITFRAKSASNADLFVTNYGTTYSQHYVLSPVYQTFVFSFTVKDVRSYDLAFNDFNNKGDIIIDSIYLIRKPLPKVTINGIDGFSSGKWSFSPQITVNDDQNITLNATAASQYAYLAIPVIAGQTYTFSLNYTGGSNVTVRINRDSQWGASLGILSASGGSITFTVPSGVTTAYINLYSNVAGTFTFSKPMLNLGSVPAPYSAKSGDKMQIPVAKKNIFDGQLIDNSRWNPTTGVSEAYTGMIRSANKYAVKPNTSYAVKNFSAACYIYLLSFKADGSFNKYESYSTTGEKDFTTDSNTYFVAFYMSKIDGSYVAKMTDLVQLEQGNVASSYSPYAVQVNKKPQRYTPQKNLFDGNLTDGYWSNGTPNNSIGWVRTPGYIPINPGMIYSWSLADGTALGDSTFAWYDINKNFIGNDYAANHGTSLIKQMPYNAYYVTLHLRGTDKTIKMQFEQSLSQTAYEPYQLSLPKSKTGLSFNGLIDYLQLPNMTMDSIEIECMIFNQNAFLLDARPALNNGFISNASGTGWQDLQVNGISTPNKKVTDIPLNQRLKVKVISLNSFTVPITIFNNFTNNATKMTGIIYKITCYLAGNIVAQYDFENKNNVVGNTIFPNIPQKNLVPNFEDAGWTIHQNAKVMGKDALHLDSNSPSVQQSYIQIPVLPNKNYLLFALIGLNADSRVKARRDSVTGTALCTDPLTGLPISFAVPIDVNMIYLTVGNNSIIGSFDFSKIQLYQLTGLEGTLYGAPKQLNKSAKRQLYAKR